MTSAEKAEIRDEIEAVLRDYGIKADAAGASPSRASLPDIRQAALCVLEGEMDSAALSAVDDARTPELALAIQRLIEVRTAASVRELEELNPYYSVSASRIIRDRPKRNDLDT